MSDEVSRLQTDRDRVAQRKPADFQEAPGETEADAARDAFLQGAGPGSDSVASALGGADSVMRDKVVSRLQTERGNAWVQRVVADSRGTPGRLVGLSQPDMVNEVVQRKGGGAPLPTDTSSQMGGFFGADLSGVRVHTDGEAHALNRELDARAFTVGSDIFFAPGQYDPASSDGQGLLAHELTHVGQQTGFGETGVQRQAVPEEEEALQRQAQPEEEELNRQ